MYPFARSRFIPPRVNTPSTFSAASSVAGIFDFETDNRSLRRQNNLVDPDADLRDRPVAVAVLLVMAAALASYVTARRASAVQHVEALVAD